MDECSAVRIGGFCALVDDFTINMMPKYLRAYLRAAAALTGGLGGHRCRPRRLRAQVAPGILSLRPVSRTVAGRKNTHARPEPRN